LEEAPSIDRRAHTEERRPTLHGHETVKLPGNPLAGEGETTDVDVLLAPLIREVWRLGIATFQCCQEECPGLASITFPGTVEAMDFLRVAQENYRTDLERWDELDDGVYWTALRLLVVFPAADIPRLVKRFANRVRTDAGEFVACKATAACDNPGPRPSEPDASGSGQTAGAVPTLLNYVEAAARQLAETAGQAFARPTAGVGRDRSVAVVRGRGMTGPRPFEHLEAAALNRFEQCKPLAKEYLHARSTRVGQPDAIGSALHVEAVRLAAELRAVSASRRMGGVQGLLFRAGEFVPPEKLNDAKLLSALIEMARVSDRHKALDEFYRTMTKTASNEG
jgi:hypothetical protein